MAKDTRKKNPDIRTSIKIPHDFWEDFKIFCEERNLINRSDVIRRGMELIVSNPILLEKDTVQIDYEILYILIRAFETTGVTITGLPDGGADRIRELIGEAKIQEVRTK